NAGEARQSIKAAVHGVHGKGSGPNPPRLKPQDDRQDEVEASRPSQSKRGVERLKLDASVLRGELPIGLGVFLVAIGLPSGDLTLEESLIRHPAIEALG